MTPGQKILVEDNFEKIIPIADCISTLFYIRLFELSPDIQSFFEDIQEIREHNVIGVMSSAINVFEDFESSLAQIEEIGRRYGAYGIKNEHYDAVGTALLWSLEQGLDKEFTLESMAAWRSMYGLLSSAMRSAASEAAA